MLAAAAVAVTLVLHNDTWNRAPNDAAILGLPWDVAYHVAWIALATLSLRLVIRAAWPREP